MMKKTVAVIFMLPLLAACSTTSPEARLAQHQDQCASYGFKPNSEAYASCMMELDLDAKADDRRRIQAVATGLQQMGQSMQPRRPVTCNTFGNTYRSGFGNTYGNATTTCY